MRELRISQCMIVKNEEKNIERALGWGKSVLWEQIVVDTGSTDRTAALAEAMGAKVFYFPWRDDFAAAKNFALEQAGGDWILFLDADEYMSGEDAAFLPGLLADGRKVTDRTMAVFARLLNLDENGRAGGGGSQLRVFRNRPDIRFIGRIHERLLKDGGEFQDAELLDACGELTVFHIGYTDVVFAETGKLERNERILLKELEERPEDFHVMGNLADTYRAMKQYGRAVSWYERAVEAYRTEKKEPGTQNLRMVWNYSYLLYLLCMEDREPDKIQKLYEEALRYAPLNCDFDYVMGRYHIGKGDWGPAARHLEQAFELLEQGGDLHFGMMLIPNRMEAGEYLAIACFNGGRKEKCVSVCVDFLKEEPFVMGILKVFLTAMRSVSAGAGQVLGFLGKLYDLSNLKDRLFVWRAAKEIGYEGLAQELKPFFSLQELEALKSMGM